MCAIINELCQDRIFLNGMEFFGYHGVLDSEKKLGQRFVVDITINTDLEQAIKTDCLDNTVNYSIVYELTKTVVEGKRRMLIESVASEIAEILMDRFPKIKEIEVTIHKPAAPINGVFRDVGVVIKRKQEN